MSTEYFRDGLVGMLDRAPERVTDVQDEAFVDDALPLFAPGGEFDLRTRLSGLARYAYRKDKTDRRKLSRKAEQITEWKKDPAFDGLEIDLDRIEQALRIDAETPPDGAHLLTTERVVVGCLVWTCSSATA